jgi:hypothetical protein
MLSRQCGQFSRYHLTAGRLCVDTLTVSFISRPLQASWTSANRKQTEKLLELIRRLAEDDKDGVMADKVSNVGSGVYHPVNRYLTQSLVMSLFPSNDEKSENPEFHH